MKSYGLKAAALVAFACLVSIQPAGAAEKRREYQMASSASDAAGASLAYFEDGTPAASDVEMANYVGRGGSFGSYDSVGTGGYGIGKEFFARPGGFFFTADYIYARASFSEALAYVVSDPNNPTAGQQYVEYDFDYKSSYRFGGGYQFSDCWGAFVFDYARYRSTADFDVTDTSTASTISIFGPYEVDAPAVDGRLTGSADVDLNVFDFALAKTLPFGGCGCCNTGCDTCCGGDTCCDDTCCDDTCCGGGSGCGGCWCPLWDFTWTGGLRFADLDWARTSTAITAANATVDTSTTRLNFEGAGARVGLLGRRYFGRSGLLSIFAKGDMSILVGDMDIATTYLDVAGANPQVTIHSNSGRRVIPVTEIETGFSAHVGKHVTASGGYFISAWHDLGFRDEYAFPFQLSHYDDANILGFDGFFARLEAGF